MKIEELELLRKEYKRLISEKENYINLKNRIAELENNPIVIEYLNTINELEKIEDKWLYSIDTKPDSYFIEAARSSVKITPTRDIYVYIGSYKYNRTEVDIEHGTSDYSVNRNSEDIDYNVYYNLELRYGSLDGEREISKSEIEEFESNHNIIVPKYSSSRCFYDLQNEYFDIAINETEEKAYDYVKRLFLKK